MAALDLSGKLYIDGIDAWNFGLAVEKGGYDDFLKYAPKKDSITHDWRDQNGIDVDLSNPVLKERTINLPCGMFADSEAEWWQQYESLLALLTKANVRRLEVTDLGAKSFYCFYSQVNSFTKLTRIKDSNKIFCKFTLVFVETEPSVDASLVFLVDEDGRFIVT